MQLSLTTTISYDPEATVPQQASEAASPNRDWWRKLPTLFWATLVLFSVNVVIGGSILLSQQLRVDAYGEELAEGDIRNDWRPSPFTEVVNSAKREVRTPERIYPAAFIAPDPSYSWAPTESYSYVDTYLDPAPTRPTTVRMTAASGGVDKAVAEPTSAAVSRQAAIRTVVYNRDTASVREAPRAAANRIQAQTELDIPRVTASLTRVLGTSQPGNFEISPRKTVSEHSETATN